MVDLDQQENKKIQKILNFCEFKKKILSECKNQDDTAIILMEAIIEIIKEK